MLFFINLFITIKGARTNPAFFDFWLLHFDLCLLPNLLLNHPQGFHLGTLRNNYIIDP